MARGRTKKADRRGLPGAPRWAWVVMVVGAIALVVLAPLAMKRGEVANGDAGAAFSLPSEAAAEPTVYPGQAASAVLALLGERARTFTVGVLGDSTGNERTEWVSLWAQQVAAQTDRPLIVHNWDATANAYSDVTEAASGASAPIVVWNGSAPGEAGSYSLDNAETILPEQPDLVFYNHGQNEGSGSAALSDLRRAAAFLTDTWQAPPALVVVLQAPRTNDPGPLEDAVTATRGWAGQQQITAIDVHAAFEAAGDLPSLLKEDGVHPNDRGSQLWADTVTAALPIPAA